ncbi:YARHG domain-containing protein [Lachnoanaerobaculum umeaense]|uniref:YARHG domain-containing protein n=2 Tax=Lachnoanaerobaculum umeaense TaxID=617123 RepID=A0A385Q0I7_9FIRM|nr:YARHG domain-containing protein [Lachnoanaerobaculum umeaense]
MGLIYLGGAMRTKRSLIFTACVLLTSLVFTGCGISVNQNFDKRAEKTSEDDDYTKANKKSKKEKKKDKEDKKEVKELKNTAVNDGNLVGNMVCYGRMVNNGDVYYFRNPKDQERIYSVDMSGNVSRISGDIFMKDMHILNGNIYYANTTTGDQKDTNFTDRNIYRYSISTGENTRLTDLGFGTGDDSWLSFESLVDNYCYFSYSNGQDGIYHICRVNTDGQDFTELFTIPAGQNVGNPNVSVVDKRYVYFLTKDGFNYYDMETKQNTVAIPGFDCQNYIIYDGTLYYTEEDPYLRSSDLTGGNQKTVYDGSGLGFAADSVQFNIYDETIYVLEKSNAQKMGSLKKMNIDGSNVVDIAEDINWFNIVNGNVFLRYWDGKSKPDTELYTYNIAANTPIGQMVNFDAAVANAKPEVEMPQINEYIFADSSTRVLTDAEVNALDQNTARYALNEIYARRGRKFKDQELQNYFNGKSWYVGTIEPDNFDESSLTAIEKENTKKLEIRKSGKMVNSTVKEEKNAEVREVIESFSLSMMEATNGEVDFEVLNDCIHIDKDMDYWYVVEGLDYINPGFAHKYLLMPSDRSVNQDEGDAFYSLYLEALEIYGKN